MPTPIDEFRNLNTPTAIGCGCMMMVAVAIISALLTAGGLWLYFRDRTPAPTPVPPPPPAPVNSLDAELDRALKDDGGTESDAAQLSAIFGQFADSLIYDGQQPAKRLNSVNDMAKAFARLQQYRFLSATTPLGERFQRCETRIAAELAARGLASPGPLDDVKRGNTAKLFNEVAEAFRE